MCLSLHSPVPLFSSITSLLPCAGADNSRLLSLSQEPLPCPEAALLQTAPPCRAWIRQCLWGQQFSRLPSFPPFLTNLSTFSFLDTCPHDFAASASLSLLSPTSLTTCFGFSLSTLGFVLSASSVPALWPSPWPTCPSLLYNNIRTRGTMISPTWLSWVLISTQKPWWGSTSSAASKRCRNNFLKQEGKGWLPDAGADKPAPSHAAGTKL